jgi:type IV pilus assembly protein PilV
MKKRMKFHNHNGFSLIEVLAAMIVLGVGLLATAKMQILALQNTQGGYMRAQVAHISYDIIDRMRTNPLAVTTGNYDLAAADATPGIVNCKGAAANCTAANMAQFDHFWWRTTISEFLPNGTGAITTVDDGTFTTVTITVTWIDPYSAADGAEQSLMMAELPR